MLYLLLKKISGRKSAILWKKKIFPYFQAIHCLISTPWGIPNNNKKMETMTQKKQKCICFMPSVTFHPFCFSEIVNWKPHGHLKMPLLHPPDPQGQPFCLKNTYTRRKGIPPRSFKIKKELPQKPVISKNKNWKLYSWHILGTWHFILCPPKYAKTQ